MDNGELLIGSTISILAALLVTARVLWRRMSDERSASHSSEDTIAGMTIASIIVLGCSFLVSYFLASLGLYPQRDVPLFAMAIPFCAAIVIGIYFILKRD
jgi:hypothetical protein